MSEAARRALAAIARDAGRRRVKPDGARVTITVGEDLAHNAGQAASDGDESHRASTAEAAGVGATFGPEDDEIDD